MKNKKCHYLVGDWCHHPDLDFQELCNHYFDNEKCNWFKPKLKEVRK